MSELKNDRFLKALLGEPVDVTPVWMMRQAGRYLPEYKATRKKAGSFLDLCKNPELACEVTIQPLDRFELDAAILFSDILTIPDAMGLGLYFAEGEGPHFKNPVQSPAAVDKLFVPDMEQELGYVMDAVRTIRKELDGRVPLIGFSGSPWTLATYMVEGGGGKDYAAVRTWAYSDPAGFGQLIGLLIEATSAYLIGQIENGAEVIQLFDTWAGVLSPSQFGRWVIEPTAAIVKNIKAAHPHVPVIGFPRGVGALYKTFVERTGVDAVSLDQTVPTDWACSVLQPLCTVQGNLDNMALVAGGESMEKEIQGILSELAGGPFIFNLGHGIVPQTPPRHVARLAEIIHHWPNG